MKAKTGLRGETVLSRGLHVEALEPRLLLSADLVPIVGEIELPGEVDLYTFELVESRDIVFDALSDNTNMTFALEGAAGQIVDEVTFRNADGQNGARIISLDAGTYTVSIDGVGDAQGNYEFRLLNLDNAAQIDIDSTVNGVLESSGRETDAFRFEGTAGTEIFIDAVAATGGTAYWSLIGPDGTSLFGSRSFTAPSDAQRVTLPSDGAYTILLEGESFNNIDQRYAFTLGRVSDVSREIDISSGPITGRIGQPSQVHTLNFTLDEAGLYLFDTLTSNDHSILLTGPRGAEINGTLREIDGSRGFNRLDLAAGTYTITLSQRQFTSTEVDSYAFQFINLATDPEEITLGTEVSGVLSDRGTLGTILRDGDPAPVAGSTQSQRFEERGVLLSVPSNDTLDLESFTFETWLKVEDGGTGPEMIVGQSSAFGFSGWGLWRDGTGQINFFVNSSNTESVVRAPIDQGAWQHVAASYDGATLKLYIDGELAAEKAYDGAFFRQTSQPLRLGHLNSSTYRLDGSLDETRLWNSARTTEEIRSNFDQQISAADGLVLSLGYEATSAADETDRSAAQQSVDVNGGPGVEVRSFFFDGAAGEQFLIDNPDRNVVTLYAPNGQRILSPTTTASFEITLPDQTGRYVVVIEGERYNVGPRNFRLTVVPTVEQSLTLTVNERVEGAIDAAGQAKAYGFTLSQETRAYFELLQTNNTALTWQIFGPNGAVFGAREFGQTGGGNTNAEGLLQLGPGDYRLVIDGVGAQTGTFEFRLTDLNAAAEAVDYDTDIDATLTPGRETRVFTFEGAVGDVISIARTSGATPAIRVIDPLGSRLVSGRFLYSPTQLTLGIAGTYTLLVEASVNSQAPPDATAVGIRVNNPSTTTIEGLTGTQITLGQRVEGTVPTRSAKVNYLFTLDEQTLVHFDALNDRFGSYWRLDSANAQLSSHRPVYTSDSINLFGNVAYRLNAGTYRIQIDAPFTAGAGYAFRLLDLEANVTPITPGVRFSGTSDTMRGTQVLSFDATTAGQRFSIENLQSDVSIFAHTYRVVDGLGRNVVSARNFSQAVAFDAPYAGQFFLLIEGTTAAQDAPVDFSLLLQEPQDQVTAIDLGDTISGQLQSVDARNVHTFTLTEQSHLVYDILTPALNTAVTLRGPDGFSRSFNLTNADSLSGGSTGPQMVLVAGDYELIVTTTNQALPPYEFRLLDSASAPEITLDTPVVGTLLPQRETDVYRFEAQAGQIVSLTDVTSGFFNGVYFRLIGPDGSSLFGPQRASSAGPFTLERTGTYLVLVEGNQSNGGSDPINYGFTVQDPRDPPVTAVALGDRLDGALSRVGQRHVYTLELTDSAEFMIDTLEASTAISVLVESANGTVRDIALQGADGLDNRFTSPLLRLGPGSYTLTVRMPNAGTSTYALRLTDVADAVSITKGEVVRGTLDPGSETDIFTFEAEAGEQVLLDRLGLIGRSDTSWRLIDPNGKHVLNAAGLLDTGLLTLPRAGTYRLLIEGRYFAGASPANYAFAIREPVVETIPNDIMDPASGVGLTRETTPEGDPALGFSGFERIEVEGAATEQRDNVSFTFRIKPDPNDETWVPVIQKATSSDPTDRAFSFFLNSGRRLYISTSDSQGHQWLQTAAGIFDWGAWIDVAAVINRDAGVMQIWMNGDLVGETSVRAGEAFDASSAPLVFGGDPLGLERGWAGGLSDFKLFDKALTGEEIAAIHGGSVAQPDAVLALPLDDAPGSSSVRVAQGSVTTQVIDVTAPLQGVLKGRLSSIGAQDIHTFTLTEDTRLYWDTLTNRAGVTAELKGPGGLLISRDLSATGINSSSTNPTFTAPAGDYTVTFSASTGYDYGYALRLLDLGSATPVTVGGTPVELDLPAGRSAVAAQFTGTAGTGAFIDVVTSSGISSSDAGIRVFDPFGRQLVQQSLTDTAEFEVSFDGTYTVVVEMDRDTRAQRGETVTIGVGGTSLRQVPITPSGPNPSGDAAFVPGPLGDAADLRGAERWTIPAGDAPSSSGSFTFEAMVKLDRYTNTWTPVIQRTDGTTFAYDMWIQNNGSVYVSTTAGASRQSAQTSGGTFSTGNWHHVAGVIDRANGQIEIYIDGVLSTARAISTQVGPTMPDTDLYLGWTSRMGSANGTFDGQMDEVRFWDHVRSAGEIAENSSRALSGSEDGLSLLLNFENGTAGGPATHEQLAPQGITGRIATPGEVVEHTFTLAEPTRLLLDAITARNDFVVTLEGPQGVVYQRDLDALDSVQATGGTNPLLLLPAGDYVLRVDGEGDASGDFVIALRDVDAEAQSIVLGDEIETSLIPGSRSQVYQIDATGIDRLFFDARGSGGNVSWRLVDPFGALVFGPVRPSDRADVAVPLDGIYTLLVEGDRNQGTRSTLTFAVGDVESLPEQPLALGANTTATLTQPGQEQVYTFTLSEDALLYMDAYSSFSGTQWSLSGPDGTLVSPRVFTSTDGNRIATNPVTAARAGAYRLTIDATNDFTGDIDFRLFNLEDEAQSLVYNDRVQGILRAEGRGTDVWKIDTARHRAFDLAQVQQQQRNAQMRFINADGYQILPRTTFQNTSGLVMPEEGPIYVLVEGAIFEAASTSTYRFELASPVREEATGRSLETFSVGASIPHELVNYNGIPAATVSQVGGDTDLRLLSLLSANNQNAVAFGTTQTGPLSTIEARFDYALTAPAIGEPGNGFNLLLMPTGSYGTDGSVPFLGLEPNSSNVLGVAVDLFQDGGDGPVPHVSLHFGSELLEVALTDVGIAASQFLTEPGQLSVMATRTDGGSLVSVTLTIDGTTTTVIDEHFVGGFDLRDRRVVIQGQNGAATVMTLDIDNVAITATAAEPAALNTLNLDETIEGDITVGSAVDIYELRLDAPARLVFDSQTNNSNISAQIIGSHGTFTRSFPFGDSDRNSNAPRVLNLPAGNHIVRIATNGSAVGSYTFTLHDAGAAAELPLETEQSYSLNPGNVTKIFAFDWTGGPGDGLRIESNRQNGGNVYYSIIGPNGSQAVASYTTRDQELAQLPVPGRYLLLLEGAVNGTAIAEGTVTLHRVDTSTQAISLDEVVTGTIADQADRADFTFTLTEPKTVILDALAPRLTANVQLIGPAGTVLDSAFQNIDGTARGGNVAMTLAAGDYTLKIDPTDRNFGDFSFVLRDLATATPVTLGETFEITADPGSSTQLRSFEATAGTQIYVDFTGGSLSGRFRIIDSFGRAITPNTNLGTDIAALTLPIDGTYTLLFEGNVTNIAAASRTLRLVPLVGTATPLTLSERTSGSLDLPGQQLSYTFTTTQAATRVLMDVEGPRDRFWSWTLTGPQGTVDGRAFSSTDSFDTSTLPLYALTPGEYTLTLAASGGRTGDFAFTLHNAADATDITPGIAQSGQLAPGNESQIFAFDAAEGERFFFDWAGQDGNTEWSLVDPFGTVLFRQTAADVDTLTLTTPGRYLLVLEGYISSGFDRDFTFNVFETPQRAPVRLTLERIPSPDLQISELRIDSSDPLVSGSVMPLAWTLENAGDVDLTEPFSTRITLRKADGTILADVLEPYDPATQGIVAAGTSVTRSALVQLPSGADAIGPITVTLRADINNTIDEQNDDGDAENNNTATLSAEIVRAAFPDLVTRGLSISPAAGWLAGESVEVSWTLANDGSKAAETPWTERLEIRNQNSNRLVYSQDVRAIGESALPPGADRTRSLEFAWPEGIDGTGLFTFSVVTDALGEVAEANDSGDAEDNNVQELVRASAPDLTISNIAVEEAETASGGPLTVSYVIKNEGAADTPGAWTDRVRVFNQSNGQLLFDVAVASGDLVLAAGAETTRQVAFTLPAGLRGTGQIRIDVTADRDTSNRDALNEARDGLSVNEAENNNFASVTVTSVPRPYADLRTTITGTSTTPRGGETGTISWQVSNAGDVATDTSSWVDKVYLSFDGVVDDTDILLASVARDGSLSSGATYDASASFTFPVGQEGPFQLLVVSDADEDITEPDTRSDNVAARQIDLTSPASNLALQTVTPPEGSFVAGEEVSVAWRVINEGESTIQSGGEVWADRVYLSMDQTLDGGDIVLGEVVRTGPLNVGQSYSVAQSFALPPGVSGDLFIIVEANADGGVFERGATGDNIIVSQSPVGVSSAPSPDLVAVEVEGPDALVPGETVDVTVTVRNDGEATATAPWEDSLYLVGPGLFSGTLLARADRDFNLAVGETYEVTFSITVPELGEEAYRFELRTDSRGRVFEGGREDNNRAESSDTALRHPNLTIATLSLDDASPTSGDTIRVTWETANTGTGPARNDWTDSLYLSRDGAVDITDIKLADVMRTAPLADGSSSVAFADVALPISVSGNWFLLAAADTGQTVSEPGNEDDNTAAAALSISLAPYADLEVSDVTAPPRTIDDPATVDVGWTVTNTGTGRGITDDWVDRVMLSRDDVLGNGDDIEIGSFAHTGGLDQGASYSRNEAITLPLASMAASRFTSCPTLTMRSLKMGKRATTWWRYRASLT
ncbi:LamG-like jellyroll fold domain-containing protein [Roseobacteraceae bacterium S113]